jgi:DNA-binding transcriptional regulator GbsR (MarR family)
LISISFCTFSSVTFTISPLANVQKEIDINTEVLEIVNSEIVKETDENVQKEIDINTEVLEIVNREI